MIRPKSVMRQFRISTNMACVGWLDGSAVSLPCGPRNEQGWLLGYLLCAHWPYGSVTSGLFLLSKRVYTALSTRFRRLEVTRTTLALEARTKRFPRKLLGKKLRAFQDIFRNRPNTKIFGQVPPAHHT